MKFGKVFKSKVAKITAGISAPVGAIALVLGLVNDLPGAYGIFTNRSGSVALTYKGEKVENVGERHVIVCLDSVKSASKLTGIYPVFSNNTSYGVNNFAMRYSVESKGVEIAPSDFYTMSQGDESDYVLKYKETLLPAFTAVERPIKNFYVAEDGGRLRLSAHASYDGINNPIVYDVYTNFYVVPYRGSLSYDDWKRLCQRKFLSDTHDIQECDVYYLTQRNGFEQEINFRLGDLRPDRLESAENIAATRPAAKKPEPERRVSPKPEPKSEPKARPAQTPASFKPAAARRPAASASEPMPFALRIEDVGGDTVNVHVDKVPCDTVLMMLVLLEDTVAHVKSNDLWVLSVDSRNYGTTYLRDKGKGRRLVDYAFCRENPALRDSVKIGSDSTLVNKLSRTIGVYAGRDFGTWYRHGIIKPGKNMRFGGFDDVRFYELPEALLVDEYKAGADESDAMSFLSAAVVVGGIFAAVWLGIVFFFALITYFTERDRIIDFEDFVRFVVEDSSYDVRKLWWQLPLSVVIAFFAGVLLLFVGVLIMVLF